MERSPEADSLTPKAGIRRLTARMIPAGHLASSFTGTDATPGAILGAFKAAAPHLGIRPRVVHAIDWLFRFTQPQDWHSGSRPIVWPSAAMQCDELCITPTQAKRLNRHLAELGLIVMHDSPNGKRYGRRLPGKAGRIIEAYGFDLSPLAVRMPEFLATAEAARAERAAIGQLRRRATIARNSLRQTIDTFRELGISDLEIPALEAAFTQTASRFRPGVQSAVMATVVTEMEALAATAREALEITIRHGQCLSAEGASPVEKNPMGCKSVPHHYSYKRTLNPDQDTVAALKECSFEGVAAPAINDRAGAPRHAPGRKDRTARGTLSTITPDEIVRLAPSLRPYLATPNPCWPELVEAADWLRHELGVSKSLWGDACITIGRERAAIALAIVATKPRGHFKTGPAGYFHGMVQKAKIGGLNLDRTIWAMRRKTTTPPPQQCQ